MEHGRIDRDESVVVGIGGTTSAIGVLQASFPRPSKIAIGGGKLVVADGVTV